MGIMKRTWDSRYNPEVRDERKHRSELRKQRKKKYRFTIKELQDYYDEKERLNK